MEENATLAVCSHCQATAGENEAYCTNCGFPIQGTIEQQAQFRLKEHAEKVNQADAPGRIRSGTNTLYVLGAIFIVLGLIIGEMNNSTPDIIVNVIMGSVFIALGYWSNTNPFAAFVTAIGIYGALIIVLAFIDPLSIVQGIILKIVVFGFLIKGVVASNALRKLENDDLR